MSNVEVEVPTGAAQVATRLESALAARGLNQSEVARQLAGAGASRRDVESRRRLLIKWLNAEHVPTSDYALQLSTILATPPDYFLVERSPDQRRGAETTARAIGADIEAIEFARQAKAVSIGATPPAFELPFGPEGIHRIVPQFNPDRILLSEVVELEPGAQAVATASFHPDTWSIGYWYSGTGIVPGILVVEALAQLGALILLTQPENAKRIALYAGLEKTRFRRPVNVGDELRLECRVSQMRGPVAHVLGRALVDASTAAQTELILVVD